MLGQMMSQPLLISRLIDHAAHYHGRTEIVSAETTGGLERTSWGEVAANSRRLASALEALGMQRSDRIATIAWNNRRHLEIYFGVSGAGLVCHTINPRLFPEQLVYIITHAEDRVLFFDRTFLPLVSSLRDKLPCVEHFVLMGPPEAEAAEGFPGLAFYDDLVGQGDPSFDWPVFDENLASSLCYTSGTTGNPKGVLYSHRTTMLHAFGANLPDTIGLRARDTVLPVVPMFHVNAWGSPYAAAMVGARVVLPGPDLDGDSLIALVDGERVTVALGVPTIWQGLIASARKQGSGMESLERTIIGGSACPPVMIETFREEFGVEVIHAWGMTEMSPLGSANHPLARHLALPPEEQAARRLSQGRPPFGVHLRIAGDNGEVLPNDGETQGNLEVRGFWVLDSYFRQPAGSALRDGWFATGDVATLDDDGYMTIRDRSKDIIKSGGEWISSVELENIAVANPALADAAVVGVRHPKWDERPLLVAVPAEGQNPAPEEVIAWFDGKIASWQKPDAVIFVEALPRNATGKVLKNRLREDYGDILTSDG